MTDEAFQMAQRRIGFKRIGLGYFLSSLVMQDEARRDERVLAERRREQEDLATRESWNSPGVRVD
jgi:hypothetical protein